MKLFQSHVLDLTLQVTDIVAQNRDAEPYAIAMVNNAAVRPYGAPLPEYSEDIYLLPTVTPWWFISQTIDFSDQYLPMTLSIIQSSLTVNESACRSQHASCLLSLPEMWTISSAYQVTDGLATESDLIDAASEDPD